MQCETLLYEGNLAFNRGEFSLAEQTYQRSLDLARRYHQPYIEIGALNGLALTATKLGRADVGSDLASSAFNFAHSRQYQVSESVALSNLAWSNQELGDLEKAIAYLSEELKVIDKLGQPQLAQTIFSNLGDTYAAQENYSAAHEAHLKALEIARQVVRASGSNDNYFVVIDLSNVASDALELGHLEEAENYSRQASALEPDSTRAQLIRGRLLAVSGRLGEATPLLRELVNSRTADKLIRWDAQFELTKIFAAEKQNARAEREFQKLIDMVELERSHLRTDENRMAFSSHSTRFYTGYVQFLITTGQRKKAFQVAEFSRGRILAESIGAKGHGVPNDIKIENVQNQIKIGKIQNFLKQQKKMILAYWLARDTSYVWLVSPSCFELFPLAPSHDIEQKAQEYNQALQGLSDPQDLEHKGQSLYQMLVAPAEKLIPQGTQLVIIPHGGLTKINFETLRVPHPSPHYWIQNVELEIASSSNLVIREGGGVSLTTQSLLAIGDPNSASSDYPPPRHASEELKRVGSHFSPDRETIVHKENAVPSAYMNNHPENFGFIHFVTHGTASELSPLESAIILSPEAGNSFKLYARDIVEIPLHARLVTISACYGLGRRSYSGEGLVGLAWAFLRAGAHQVVAGLWDVDDSAAVNLMDDFYTELQKGKPASTALRLAKLKMVNSDSTYNRPYYWASLQLYMGS